MKYRVLKQEAETSMFDVLRDKDYFTDHGLALVNAEQYVKARSGRRAIVVADRDTFTSSTTTKHEPGTGEGG